MYTCTRHEAVKILGATITDKLSMSDHVRDVTCKCAQIPHVKDPPDCARALSCIGGIPLLLMQVGDGAGRNSLTGAEMPPIAHPTPMSESGLHSVRVVVCSRLVVSRH